MLIHLNVTPDRGAWSLSRTRLLRRATHHMPDAASMVM